MSSTNDIIVIPQSQNGLVTIQQLVKANPTILTYPKVHSWIAEPGNGLQAIKIKKSLYLRIDQLRLWLQRNVKLVG